MKNYLNFEIDIKNLENEIENLKDPYNQSGLTEVDTQKISNKQNQLNEKLKIIGFTSVEIDREGYRPGKINVIPN